MTYLRPYARARVWLSDHPKVHAAIQYSPLGVLLLFGLLIETDVIWDDTAYSWIWSLAAAWLSLWTIHRVLLRLSMNGMRNPEPQAGGYRR